MSAGIGSGGRLQGGHETARRPGRAEGEARRGGGKIQEVTSAQTTAPRGPGEGLWILPRDRKLLGVLSRGLTRSGSRVSRLTVATAWGSGLGGRGRRKRR